MDYLGIFFIRERVFGISKIERKITVLFRGDLLKIVLKFPRKGDWEMEGWVNGKMKGKVDVEQRKKGHYPFVGTSCRILFGWKFCKLGLCNLI